MASNEKDLFTVKRGIHFSKRTNKWELTKEGLLIKKQEAQILIVGVVETCTQAIGKEGASTNISIQMHPLGTDPNDAKELLALCGTGKSGSTSII